MPSTERYRRLMMILKETEEVVSEFVENRSREYLHHEDRALLQAILIKIREIT